MIGRKKPYTARGISRVKCAKQNCNEPGLYQWQCCALDNRWFALCAEHDVGLNDVATNYILGAKAATPLMARYARRVFQK